MTYQIDPPGSKRPLGVIIYIAGGLNGKSTGNITSP